MDLLIYGPGRLGGAIAHAAADAGWVPALVGRPDAEGARAAAPTAAVVVEVSSGPAVAPASASDTTSPRRASPAAKPSAPESSSTAATPRDVAASRTGPHGDPAEVVDTNA